MAEQEKVESPEFLYLTLEDIIVKEQVKAVNSE